MFFVYFGIFVVAKSFLCKVFGFFINYVTFATLFEKARSYILWSVHLRVRIQDFHSCHRGSNPLRTTININNQRIAELAHDFLHKSIQNGCFFYASILKKKPDLGKTGLQYCTRKIPSRHYYCRQARSKKNRLLQKQDIKKILFS